MKKHGLLNRLTLISVNDHSKVALFKHIIRSLNEPNIYLIERAVFYLPENFCRSILQQTLAIVRDGGYRTYDNSRFKSPGGIFLRILKNSITKDELKLIWNTKKKKKKQEKKRIKNQDVSLSRTIKSTYSDEEGALSPISILTDDLHDTLLIKN
ncbi:uncharacterized protein CMU_025400 [Cryptosporidium muris RN66]|uniref:Phosphorylated adapter RNA export protein n=1 Tax=Cryptosporidium muris (strain RN66) TaxID=441375 RepID=B6AAY2_CRYMR|nr:uncharacterized protein CMU_025400 [Cryptosporidium muris RN66]EEA05534.1 hypothetical protein, conserved [Cryptosporidium muris RN66]|eukprot:XP_002139883.1 hypothetical protein [Cryptosporidium muris RN66]